MKKYISQRISSIDLDPKQAIIQACMLGGLYLFPGAPGVYACGKTTGTGPACANTAKGSLGGGSTSMLTSTLGGSLEASGVLS
ncbi:MAG: hypothetical protein PHQ52_01100 [Candidatus Omnitrophica bacterium]|nr:hypothetical protein [Candidatus Omnitrophota bacterium]